MTGIVLYDYWRSSAAYRVRIALNILGLEYSRHDVDLLKGEQRQSDNLERNPQGLVPTLEIDGLRLTQTLATIEYLNETRGGSFLPADPAGKARVRTLAYAVAMEIHPVCNPRVARHAAGAGGEPALREWMQHFISLGFDGLEGLLRAGAKGQFCHGDQVTMADICLVPQVYNARRWEIDLGPFPLIQAITERACALPAFAAAHPDRFRPAE